MTVFLLFALFFKCSNVGGQVLPHILVYKTRADYKELVPIGLSPDKKTITYFPDPKDIGAMGDRAKPVTLQDGYMWSKSGISKDVAFLDMTFQAYMELPGALPPAELMHHIKDARPLTLFCDCGPSNQYKNVEQELNNLILTHTLPRKCKVLYLKGLKKKQGN